MNRFTVCAALTALVFDLASAAEAEAELGVTTDFMPEECEQKVKNGDEVQMHYTGTIDESSMAGKKGSQFDSSVGRDPFKFQIGAGQVIKGWDQGIVGMCVGEKRTLIVPPALGYGDAGAGADIPGGATLKFTVECIGTAEAPPPPNFFKAIDLNEDGKLTKEEVSEWFKKEQGRDMPDELMDKEDANSDGSISWDEFSGPKGDAPAHDEL